MQQNVGGIIGGSLGGIIAVNIGACTGGTNGVFAVVSGVGVPSGTKISVSSGSSGSDGPGTSAISFPHRARIMIDPSLMRDSPFKIRTL